MLGKLGEQLVQARDFYPLFTVTQEWRLVLGSKSLGTIPLSNPVAVDNLVLFAGRRWRIVSVDEKAPRDRGRAPPGRPGAQVRNASG